MPDEPTTSKSSTILIIDDRPIVRTGLRTWLAADSRFGQILEAATAADGLATLTRDKPQLTILSMRLPDASAEGFFKAIQPHRWSTYFVVFSVLLGDDDLLLAARSGVRAVLRRNTSEAEVIHTIERVLAGENCLMNLMPATFRDRLNLRDLTPTELQILTHLGHGRSNREISTLTSRSDNTVKVHLRNIFSKLAVTKRAEAAAAAVRRGLVD